MKGTFGGGNIKGNPKMASGKVAHDFRIMCGKFDVFVVQEFKWRSYWIVAAAIMGFKFSSYPGRRSGAANPVKGGQAIFWLRSRWTKLNEFIYPAFDFDKDNSGIMENRWIRAVLLKNKKGRFTSWFLSTHFVVGGDEQTDGPRRKAFLQDNLNRFDHVLALLRHTGHAIMGEIDANIHPGTWAYAEFMKILHKHGATIHGQHGVEFAFTIPGDQSHYESIREYVIPTTSLYTDHEIRCLEFKGVPE